jgi:hypothetical protein
VPEMDTALQELLHGDDLSHWHGPFLRAPRRSRAALLGCFLVPVG